VTKDDKKDRKDLLSLVRPVIEGADEDSPVSPNWVATKVMKGITDFYLRLAAHYALREVARSIMRERSGPVAIGSREEVTKQLDLPGFELLHEKYPKPDGSGYIFIESLTYEEAEWNAQQLEKFGRSAILHAQQLRRWVEMRRAS
jgi:hypothetical protein